MTKEEKNYEISEEIHKGFLPNMKMPLTVYFRPLAGKLFTGERQADTIKLTGGDTMKVNIFYVNPDGQERADLYVKTGHRSLEELISFIENESYKEMILAVADGKEKYQINCKHVFFIESVKDRLLIHTDKRVFQYHKKLYELENELPDCFSRISKSVILNLSKVEHYSPQLNGIMKAVLKNSEEVYISRKYLRGIRSKIGGR